MTSLFARVTVAAVVERDGRFLLVRERTRAGVALNQPAGHWEYGESLIQAVKRETWEETGWHFEPLGLVGVYQWEVPDPRETFLRFCFYGQCTAYDEHACLDEGIIEAVWLFPQQLAGQRLRSPLVESAIRDFLNGKRYPLEILREL